MALNTTSSLWTGSAEEHSVTRRKRSRKPEDIRVFNKHQKKKKKTRPAPLPSRMRKRPRKRREKTEKWIDVVTDLGQGHRRTYLLIFS